MTGRSTPGTFSNSRGVTMARLLAVVGSLRGAAGWLFCSASFCLAAARRFRIAARSARAICSARTAGSTASGSVAAMCSILATWFLACSARSSRAASACSTVMPSGVAPPGPAPSAAGAGGAGACWRGRRRGGGPHPWRRRPSGPGNHRGGPGPRRHRDNGVGLGGRGRFGRQLQKPQLASRGRSSAGQLAFLLCEFLDGAQRGAVPCPDLGRPLRASGRAQSPRGVGNATAPAGDFGLRRLARVRVPRSAGSRRSSLACRNSRRLRMGGCS